MASSSSKVMAVSPPKIIPDNNNDDDDIYKQIDNYRDSLKEHVENPMTNINIHLANVNGQHADLMEGFKEINKNILAQQKQLLQEIVRIMKDVRALRR